jgi:hypothetical protein
MSQADNESQLEIKLNEFKESKVIKEIEEKIIETTIDPSVSTFERD